jgi:hypothetical protein
MGDNVISLADRREAPGAGERLADERCIAFLRGAVDADRLAAELGTPEQWRGSAISHLKAASSCPAPDGVIVCQAALHLVLDYVAHLERQLGIIPASNGAT